jgi:hypothetical protein
MSPGDSTAGAMSGPSSSIDCDESAQITVNARFVKAVISSAWKLSLFIVASEETGNQGIRMARSIT